jgi:transcriptional regulator with XRE-family HTH domain
MENLIRNARILKGYTQEQMAEYMNLSQSQYCRMENSGSGLDMERISDISRILSIEIQKLIPLAEDNFPGIDKLLDRINSLEREKHMADMQARVAIQEVGRLGEVIHKILNAVNENDFVSFKRKLFIYLSESKNTEVYSVNRK